MLSAVRSPLGAALLGSLITCAFTNKLIVVSHQILLEEIKNSNKK